MPGVGIGRAQCTHVLTRLLIPPQPFHATLPPRKERPPSARHAQLKMLGRQGLLKVSDKVNLGPKTPTGQRFVSPQSTSIHPDGVPVPYFFQVRGFSFWGATQ